MTTRLKIISLVAGLHLFAFILILANPGCSSTSKSAPAPADMTPAADGPSASAAAPSQGAPGAAPGGLVPAGDAAGGPGLIPPGGAAAAGADAGGTPSIRFSPTRPGTAVAGALEPAPSAEVTPAITYTVVSGDSLSRIAHNNHITVADLAGANGLKVQSTLHLGQKLVIPAKGRPAAPAARSAPTADGALTGTGSAGTGASGVAGAAPAPKAEPITHTVKAGETLGSIAKHYGVRTGDIATANNIQDPRLIKPGQQLIIPAKSSKSARSSKGRPATGADSPAAPAPGGTAPAPSAPEAEPGLRPDPAGSAPSLRPEDPGAPTAGKTP